MVQVVSGRTCAETWLQAIRVLQNAPDHQLYNLVVEVEDPMVVTAADSGTVDAVNELLTAHDSDPIATIAGTIFPMGYYHRYGADGVYSRYPSAYRRVRRGWGSYALRLVERETRDGGTMNPLACLVEKLRRQLGHGHKRAVYELGTLDVMLDMPIYDVESDAERLRPHPCLSHLSLKLMPGERLGMTALYRYHYYVSKALGNLVGLAQLQGFIATEVGIASGPLVCHSTFAVLDRDSGWRLDEIRGLVESQSV